MTLLARRLVEPDHDTGPEYVETFGPAVADLNASIGFAPDPQQEHALNKIFGIRPDGLSACFEYGCVVCRQNLKTGLFKQVAIGWLFVLEVPWFVWSAHEMSTTLESQREIHTLIAESSLSRMLPATRNEGLYEDNNKTRIELKTGQRILFKARTLSGGRGLAAPKVILDEAFALKPSHVGSLIPALAAQADPQVLYGSSAGKVDSTILFDIRDRGRSGSSARLGYDEWLAPREPCRDDGGRENPDCQHPKDALARGIDCALDRPHLRLKANPTLTTGRITMETLDGLRQALPPEEFARECLGWWDEPNDGAMSVFGRGRWPACKADPFEFGEPPTDGLTIGVAVSIDQQWTSLGAGARWPDARIHVGPTEDADGLVDRRRGTLWVPARAKELQDRHGCAVVIDEKCPDPNLPKSLEDAGVKVHRANLEEVVTACAGIFNDVRDGQLTHFGTPELDDAVTGAVQRPVGDRWAWGRRKSETDVSMLEAVTLAAHGVREDLRPSKGFNIW